MCTAGCILSARTVEMHGCSTLSHDRQQGSVRQKTYNPELVKNAWKRGPPSARTRSPKSSPLQSPFTVAPCLAHLPLQEQQPVSRCLGRQLRQTGKTGRRVGGGGDAPKERNPHELWESEFGLGRERRVLPWVQ